MSYLVVPNGDVDPESPITTSLMTRMRDNPIDIANADDGSGSNIAPRVLARESGASALASPDAPVGSILKVVSDSNPGLLNDGTPQGGQLIRPVAPGNIAGNIGIAAAAQGHDGAVNRSAPSEGFSTTDEDIMETETITVSNLNKDNLFITAPHLLAHRGTAVNVGGVNLRGAYPVLGPTWDGTATISEGIIGFPDNHNTMVKMFAEDTGTDKYFYGQLHRLEAITDNVRVHITDQSSSGFTPPATVDVPDTSTWTTIIDCTMNGGTYSLLQGWYDGTDFKLRTVAKVDSANDYAYCSIGAQFLWYST